jgi:hypothetical protein
LTALSAGDLLRRHCEEGPAVREGFDRRENIWSERHLRDRERR